MKDYWSIIVEGNTLYQMGAQSHRVFMLNLLKKYDVKSLLDVGCGTAPIYQLLEEDKKTRKEYENIERYKGVDPSEAMIQSCQVNFPQGTFAVEDATDLHKEQDATWDCLLYMHSFDYVYNYKKAIKEMYRVTKKYVVIILWQPMDLTHEATHRLNNSVNGAEKVDWSTARLQHFAWRQLEKELQEAGLGVILMENGEQINKEGKMNTLIMLEKI